MPLSLAEAERLLATTTRDPHLLLHARNVRGIGTIVPAPRHAIVGPECAKPRITNRGKDRRA